MSHDDPMSETNGKRPPIDPELISAFFDGETTPEERAAVEQVMDGGGAALPMLDEYDQLSQSLKQLHRATTAVDLRSSVLAQIRPPAQVVKAPPSAPRRRLLSVVAGLTGMAAAVTLLLWPRPQAERETMLAVNDAVYEATSLEAPAAMSAPRALTPAAGAPADEAAPELATMSAGEMARMEADVNSSLAEMTSKRPLPEAGDVLGYLDRNADELTWVAVTVVDVQTAGDQVQLLLSRHGVPSPGDADEAASATGTPEPVTDPENHVTFLVEADWDQMEGVIVDLNKLFVDSVEVDVPPDETVPESLQSYAVARADRPAQAQEAPPASASLRNAEDGRGTSSDAPAPADADAKSEAVQVQVMMPDSVLRQIAARRDAERSAAEDQPAAGARAAAEAEKLAAEARRIDRPLASRRAKVVIVLHKQNR